MQAPKNGFFYVLDAASGELISAENFVPVSWASHVDIETGRPVETGTARFERTGAPAWVTPAPAGGHNWYPMAYSPQTGLIYIPVIYGTWAYALVEDFEVSTIAANRGTDVARAMRMLSDPGIPPELAHDHDSALLAWDPVRQEAVWEAPYEHFGPRTGGALATAGGLVFHASGDDALVAYRASDGERVWSADTQTGVLAPPISYAIDGEQFVAVAAGRATGGYYAPNTARLLVFKLGGDVELPPAPDYAPPPLDPPELVVAADVAAHGEAVYFRTCAICHGVDGEVRGGLFPDLRRSAALHSADTFRAVVLDGMLSANGMASFAEALSAEDAEAVRAYIVSLAQEAVPAADPPGGPGGPTPEEDADSSDEESDEVGDRG
jgi:mono/diheme cytochrome c family protein